MSGAYSLTSRYSSKTKMTNIAFMCTNVTFKKSGQTQIVERDAHMAVINVKNFV